jgi:cob(I)alamin adenosyltransferase
VQERPLVKLTKIYTRTGDDGTTGLGTGGRVLKDDLRVEAYGEVDEANAAIGYAVVACAAGGASGDKLSSILRDIQQDLFDVGADLCIPRTAGEEPGTKLRVQAGQTQRLEKLIDEMNAHLAPLNSFILPGGTPLAAALHMARTIVRRAERRVVTLRRADAVGTGEESVRYLNRLSDLLFVLGRVANATEQDGGPGPGDVLWIPGVNRGK